jgi:hypothetical protein
MFHCTMAALATLLAGTTNPSDSLYERVYRRPDHKEIFDICQRYKNLCEQVHTTKDAKIDAFAAEFQTLYRKRLDADYKPSVQFSRSDAISLIRTAREAIEQFNRADANARKTFLTFIVFPPRKDV